MKIRFYTTNKEAIVFDLEDILKQLNSQLPPPKRGGLKSRRTP